MGWRFAGRGGGVWVGGLLLGCLAGAVSLGQAGAGQGQGPAAAPVQGAGVPCGDAKAGKPCAGPAAGPGRAPSVSEQFPFPGEDGGAGAVPDAPKAGDGSGKAVKDQFPFPGEAPVEAPAEGGAAGEGSSSSSSSAGAGAGLPGDGAGDASGGGDGKPKLKDEGSEGSTPRTRRRLRPQAQKILSDDERVDEDLSVAEFYRKSGNLNGAYLRAKDALKLQPEYSDAHLAVAEAAEKLGKKEEAVGEYRAYLKLDPAGEGAKGARQALEKLER